MATIASEAGSGLALDAALTTTRNLDNGLGGSGTRAWANPGTGTFIRGDGAGAFYGESDSARAWVAIASANYQATIDFNLSAGCNLIVGGCKTTAGGVWDAGVVALLVGTSDLRIREYDAGGSPTDRATLTISPALSTGTNYKLQFIRSGNNWTARVLNSGGAVVGNATLPYAAGSTPSGTYWGFGFLNGGTTAVLDNFLVEDAAAAAVTIKSRRRKIRWF